MEHLPNSATGTGSERTRAAWGGMGGASPDLARSRDGEAIFTFRLRSKCFCGLAQRDRHDLSHEPQPDESNDDGQKYPEHHPDLKHKHLRIRETCS
jgi:hypothetical protein